jgi:hypothetical protein
LIEYARIWSWFVKMDTDHNGYFDSSERMKMIEELGGNFYNKTVFISPDGHPRRVTVMVSI